MGDNDLRKKETNQTINKYNKFFAQQLHAGWPRDLASIIACMKSLFRWIAHRATVPLIRTIVLPPVGRKLQGDPEEMRPGLSQG